MTDITETESPAEYWQRQVETWRASGTSQARYCTANGLRYSRFLYWRRKLDRPSTPPADSDGSPGFARVSAQDTSYDLSISLPSGLVIRGISADNVAVVHQLLAQLP